MIWESPPESILIIRKLDYDTTGPFIEVLFISVIRQLFFRFFSQWCYPKSILQYRNRCKLNNNGFSLDLIFVKKSLCTVKCYISVTVYFVWTFLARFFVETRSFSLELRVFRLVLVKFRRKNPFRLLSSNEIHCNLSYRGPVQLGPKMLADWLTSRFSPFLL